MNDFNKYIFEANVKYNQGDYQKAVELYKKASGIDPNNPDVWIYLGNAITWPHKSSRDTALAIEQSYNYYARAIDVAKKEKSLDVNREILNGLIKQANVLAGGILKCQNSEDSYFQIEEMVNSNRIMLTWITSIFTSPKFDFSHFEEDQFDFVLSLINLIFLNIKEYYNRVPNSDPEKDLRDVKIIFTYELLPFLKTLDCYKQKKQDIVNEIRNKIDCIREEIDKLANEKYLLEEEREKGDLRLDLERLKYEKKQLKLIKKSKERVRLKVEIDKMEKMISKTENYYKNEIDRIDRKVDHMEKQVEYLQKKINESMSLFL